jgi:hypothetical protein
LAQLLKRLHVLPEHSSSLVVATSIASTINDCYVFKRPARTVTSIFTTPVV